METSFLYYCDHGEYCALGNGIIADWTDAPGDTVGLDFHLHLLVWGLIPVQQTGSVWGLTFPKSICKEWPWLANSGVCSTLASRICPGRRCWRNIYWLPSLPHSHFPKCPTGETWDHRSNKLYWILLPGSASRETWAKMSSNIIKKHLGLLFYR